jgi:hypothetical protein
MDESKKQIFALIDKAAKETDASEAMKFAQAALNAANALLTLSSLVIK